MGSLRELFRHIQHWRSIHELEGVEVIRCPTTLIEWSIWDIEYLLQEGLERLTPRQKQAITLCLVQDMKESNVAQIMGVAPTNPVAMYATDGIKTLLRMIDQGELPMVRETV